MTIAKRISLNERHFTAIGLKRPQFSWCVRCAGAEGCYCNGTGPNFLDPDCYHGPMTETELESAKNELEDL